MGEESSSSGALLSRRDASCEWRNVGTLSTAHTIIMLYKINSPTQISWVGESTGKNQYEWR